MAKSTSIDQVIEKVAEDYDENTAKVAKDANSFLKSLRAKKLLVPA